MNIFNDYMKKVIQNIQVAQFLNITETMSGSTEKSLSFQFVKLVILESILTKSSLIGNFNYHFYE